jgi:hypothetical protein
VGFLCLHQIGHDLEKLKADGCQLVEPQELFIGLMLATRGDPCTTGCAYFKDGKCPAYLKHHSDAQEAARAKQADYRRSHSDQSGMIGGQWSGMSIKQIAEKEGISLNQARENKRAGKYAE